MNPSAVIKIYYRLAKPGIIYGNLLTATGGFLLASHGHPHLGLLAALLGGLGLVIGSACVFNNYIDRGIDARMSRTKGRALVKGQVSSRNALVYGTVLGLAGFAILVAFTNLTTVLVVLVSAVVYDVLYGIAKRRGPYGTLVGSISGAAPVVAGYCAVTHRLDLAAFLLFVILALWQMPHFYAIAIYRLKDYAAAGIPVLPVKRGIGVAKVHMIAYVIAFILAAAALAIFGYAGYVYLAVMVFLGLGWLHLALKGLVTPDDIRWARGLFRFSLVVIATFSLMISLTAFLP